MEGLLVIEYIIARLRSRSFYIIYNKQYREYSMGKSYYQMLGVSQSASQSQIKKAYKELALKYHPDKNPDNKEQAKEKFTKISEAYSVLSNPQTRAAYDREKSSDAKSNSSRGSRNEYKWKNPEFDPDFDHFADLPEHIKNFGNKNSFKDFNFPTFDCSKWFSEQFGSFDFEMAEQIFEKAFKDFEKGLPQLQIKQGRKGVNVNTGQVQKSHSTVQSGYKSMSQYKPKNGVLVEQKTIERNGNKILVKKFNITQNGKTYKETREVVIGKI